MTASAFLSRPSTVELALKRRLVEQESLVALSQLALESGDPFALMQVAADRLAEIQNVELVFLMEWIGDTNFVIRAVVGGTDEPGNFLTSLDSGTPAGRAFMSDATVLVGNLNADPRFPGPITLKSRGVVSGITTPIPNRDGPWGVLGVWTRGERRFGSDDSHLVEAVANMVGWVVGRGEVESRLADAVREKDQRLRTETALAWCARSLLGDSDTAAVETSLRSLMEATNSSYGFVDWLGTPGQSRLPAVRLGRLGRKSALDRHWESVSWDELPTLRDQLERGQTAVIRVSDLAVGEATAFLTAPEIISSEIDVPIQVQGRWIGTLGLSDRDERRQWSDDEIRAIELGASLLAAWWERRDYARQLEEAIEFRNRLIRLEQGIAGAAQLLSRATEESEIEEALGFLLDGTDATAVFVERNVTDPDLGLCSRVVASAQRNPDAGYDPSYWDMMPWEKMPVSYAALSQGREVVITPDSIDGPEASVYAASSVTSEIDVPIMIDGQWVGLIGLADADSGRDWSEELQLLRAAADMIGAFWARLDALHRLEEMIRSKDDFIASISHELRTPLTAVVGLAETISDEAQQLSETESRELMSIIAEQSAEMAAIVQDLLVVARSDSGRVTIRPESLDLFEETLKAQRGVRLENKVVALEGHAVGFADAVRVRQVLRNLLVNAGRYGGPNVRVAISTESDRALVRVADDGFGIPLEDRDRVFQRYQRAHHRDGQPASVGLGLTVSRQLAELMGGTLTYDFDRGWSTFTLSLPTGS